MRLHHELFEFSPRGATPPAVQLASFRRGMIRGCRRTSRPRVALGDVTSPLATRASLPNYEESLFYKDRLEVNGVTGGPSVDKALIARSGRYFVVEPSG